LKRAKVVINHKEYPVNLAITGEEQARGLMFQRPPVENMAFLYFAPGYHPFWMKNTLAPLDIVFCNNGEVIDIQHGEPLSLASIGPSSDTDLVLEFNLGFAAKEGIKIGSKVVLIS
jgi:uncharacterized membrane protein (UPF0127 family)